MNELVICDTFCVRWACEHRDEHIKGTGGSECDGCVCVATGANVKCIPVEQESEVEQE